MRLPGREREMNRPQRRAVRRGKTDILGAIHLNLVMSRRLECAGQAEGFTISRISERGPREIHGLLFLKQMKAVLLRLHRSIEANGDRSNCGGVNIPRAVSGEGAQCVWRSIFR